MVIVFCLGLLAASITERRAEIQSIYANKKDKIAPFESRNEMYKGNYPREYETWTQTADTTFRSEFNGSQALDVLAQRPNMVIFWAGYAFSREYTSPRGHMHAIEDMSRTLRTGHPGIDGADDMQPATCWTCKSSRRASSDAGCGCGRILQDEVEPIRQRGGQSYRLCGLS